MAHLILHVCQRRAVLYEQAAEGVAKIMEAESTQPGAVKAGQELVLGQVALVEDRARFRREYEILSNARLTLHERL
ncbi:MAG: hypothetical protein WA741_12765 [Candidatus Sulfotelmatobacter sp.]